jgi:hypothetical protein
VKHQPHPIHTRLVTHYPLNQPIATPPQHMRGLGGARQLAARQVDLGERRVCGHPLQLRNHSVDGGRKTGQAQGLPSFTYQQVLPPSPPFFPCPFLTGLAPPRRHRANIDIQDEQGASALHHAAKSGTVKTVKLLLVAGAERRCHDRNQKTPIDWAEEYKRPHALEVLRLEWEEMGRDGDGWKGIGSTRIYAYTHTRIHARTPSISFCLSCIHMHAHTQ